MKIDWRDMARECVPPILACWAFIGLCCLFVYLVNWVIARW